MNNSLNRLWVVADSVSGTVYFASPNYNQAKSRYDLELINYRSAVSDLIVCLKDKGLHSDYNFNAASSLKLLRYDLSRHYLTDAFNAADTQLVSDFRRFLDFAFCHRSNANA